MKLIVLAACSVAALTLFGCSYGASSIPAYPPIAGLSATGHAAGYQATAGAYIWGDPPSVPVQVVSVAPARAHVKILTPEK